MVKVYLVFLLFILPFSIAAPLAAKEQGVSVDHWQVKASGRDCPDLEGAVFESDHLALAFKTPIKVGDQQKRIERMFCQITIEAIDSAKESQSLQIDGLSFDGFYLPAVNEEGRIDLTMYQQGEKNHWQDLVRLDSQGKVGKSSAKPVPIQYQKSLPSSFKLACQVKRAFNFKISVLWRRQSSSHVSDQPGVMIEPKLKLKTQKEACPSSSGIKP